MFLFASSSSVIGVNVVLQCTVYSLGLSQDYNNFGPQTSTYNVYFTLGIYPCICPSMLELWPPQPRC
jgi:hypothetical protein